MHLFRLYTPSLKNTKSSSVEFVLNPELSHRVLNVLRLKPNDSLLLFDGYEKEHVGRIVTVDKKKPQVIVQLAPSLGIPESPLSIHLAQAISRGDKMDYTIQKSVELGVKKITPLFTKRGEVKLAGDRLQKRLAHWEAVAISACEQSGRVFLPPIEPPPPSFSDWLKETQTKSVTQTKLILDPRARENLSASVPLENNSVLLVVGPESGFTEEEVESAKTCGFQPVHLGPRVLRTETAGPTAVAILQSYLGDM